jgi:hypothetical protein
MKQEADLLRSLGVKLPLEIATRVAADLAAVYKQKLAISNRGGLVIAERIWPHYASKRKAQGAYAESGRRCSRDQHESVTASWLKSSESRSAMTLCPEASKPHLNQRPKTPWSALTEGNPATARKPLHR